MRSSGLSLSLLVTSSLLSFSLLSSTASAAQSPACAKASAARAVKSKDYKRLKAVCDAESKQPTPRPALKPKHSGPGPTSPVVQQNATAPQKPRGAGRRRGPLFPWVKVTTGGNQATQPAQPAPPPRPAAPPAPRRPTAAPTPAPAPAPPAAAPAPAPAAPYPNAVAAPVNPNGVAAHPSPDAVATPPNPNAASPDRPRAGADAHRVFGLRLGDVLRMPACGDDAARDTEVLQSLTATGAAQRRINQSCRFAPSAMNGNARLFAQRLANVTADPLPAGVDFSLVAITSQRCPDWVNAAGSCVAGITTKDGQIIGISYLAGDDTHQASIEKSLSDKYTATPRTQTAAPCQDPKLGARAGTNRTWESSGVLVSYFPTGGLNCRQGRVLVESDGMRQLLAPGADKRQASERR